MTKETKTRATMTGSDPDNQCSSCGGFCSHRQCERSNVVELPANRHDLQAMVTAIKEALYNKRGQPVNFVEALGALELVKMELFHEGMNCESQI